MSEFAAFIAECQRRQRLFERDRKAWAREIKLPPHKGKRAFPPPGEIDTDESEEG